MLYNILNRHLYASLVTIWAMLAAVPAVADCVYCVSCVQEVRRCRMEFPCGDIGRILCGVWNGGCSVSDGECKAPLGPPPGVALPSLNSYDARSTLSALTYMLDAQ